MAMADCWLKGCLAWRSASACMVRPQAASRRSFMSASLNWMPCLVASGSPPTRRWLAQSAAALSAASAMPSEVAATSRRLLSSTFMAILKPVPSSPRRLAAGTRTLSSDTSKAWPPRMPISFSGEEIWMPGRSRGTMKALTPRAPASMSVLANTTMKVASAALEMKCFTPVSTYSSPSRTALVRMSAGCEPPRGSVSAKAASHSPLAQRGSHCWRCASLPPISTASVPR